MPVSRNTRDDAQFARPQQLPHEEFGNNPAKRAADKMIESFNQRSNGIETWEADNPVYKDPVLAAQFAMMEQNLNDHVANANRSRISDIKEIVSKLTYGEMISLAEQLSDAMPEGSVEKDPFKYILPPTLHKWVST